MVHSAFVLLMAGSAILAQASRPRPTADEKVKPVYRKGARNDSAVVRFCEALHDLPESRRAACCRRRMGTVATGLCIQALSSAVRSKALAVDEAKLRSCLSSLRTSLEGCEWIGPLRPPLPEDCQGVLVGKIPVDKACKSSLECHSGLICYGAGPTQAGRCIQSLPAGASCGTGVDVLVAYTGLNVEGGHRECQGYCLGHRCTNRSPIGSECKASMHCVAGAHCADGKCVAGSVARIGDDCSGGDCETGSRCIRKRCSEPLASGASCTMDQECRGGCLPADGGGVCGIRCESR